ncbi:hypothetical protein ACLOJK_000412 [Asimina triloba]
MQNNRPAAAGHAVDDLDHRNTMAHLRLAGDAAPRRRVVVWQPLQSIETHPNVTHSLLQDSEAMPDCDQIR